MHLKNGFSLIVADGSELMVCGRNWNKLEINSAIGRTNIVALGHFEMAAMRKYLTSKLDITAGFLHSLEYSINPAPGKID